MRMKALPAGLLALSLALSGCASVPAGPAHVDRFEQLLDEANKAYSEARLDDAERLLLEITSEYPSVAAAWFRLGNIYYRTGRYPAAVRAYEQTLLYEVNHANAWHNLALTRLKQGIETLEAGMKNVPDSNPERNALVELHKRLVLRVSE